MTDRDEGKRAAEEAEALLIGERAEESKKRRIVLLDREATAVLEILSHIKAISLMGLFMEDVNLSQATEDSSTVLLQKLQGSKSREGFEPRVEIETSYMEIDGFSGELKSSLPWVVSMAQTFGSSEPQIYVAQIPLILNNALVAAGGRNNQELREYWEGYIQKA